MADELDEEVQDPQDPQDEWKAKYEALKAQHDSLQQDNRHLVKESQKYRERAKKAEFARLKQRFPTLDEADLDGLNVDQLEAVLSKVAGPQSPEAEQQAEEPAVPPEVRQEAQAFVQGAQGGQAPPPAQKISFQEAKQRGGPSNPEVRELIRQGLVEGVRAP